MLAILIYLATKQIGECDNTYILQRGNERTLTVQKTVPKSPPSFVRGRHLFVERATTAERLTQTEHGRQSLSMRVSLLYKRSSVTIIYPQKPRRVSSLVRLSSETFTTNKRKMVKYPELDNVSSGYETATRKDNPGPTHIYIHYPVI